MKKLLVMLFVITTIFSITALAAGVILPDPGHYFGRSYDGYMIEFDKYPKEEFDAYVKLLTEQYGMQITEEGGMGADEYVFMEKPGTQDTEVFVSCFESEYECGMEIIVDDGITLSELDSYKTRSSSEPGIIAWDDGRMIADPGDFLGYKIQVTEIQDQRNWNYGGNYFQREYEETDTHDIRKYIDALESSPYFEICDTHEAKSASYKQIFFEYVGSDPELIAICEEGRRNPKRTCDLYIQIHYRDRERSTFRIVTFPGFTVNSEATVNPDPDPDPNSGEEQPCMFCNKGKCKKCGGEGFVYQYSSYEKDWREKKDCSSCISGSCTFCGGDGKR